MGQWSGLKWGRRRQVTTSNKRSVQLDMRDDVISNDTRDNDDEMMDEAKWGEEYLASLKV